MSRMISIVGFNEKEKAMPDGHWEIVPGESELVHHDERIPTPYGLQGRVYDQWEPKKKWVNDPPVYVSSVPTVYVSWVPREPFQTSTRDRFNWLSFFIKWIMNGIIFLVVFALVVVVWGVISYNYAQSGAYKSKVASQSLQNGTTSTWDGDETQSGYHFKMIFTIDSIKNGSFHGKVHWPDQQYIHDTLTKAEGTIVANVNHKDIHWKYVDTCNGGKYLEFTETQFIQGNSVVLRVKYYAVVCFVTLSGVWFYPDKPNDTPGGEFSLQWKSP